MPRKRKSYDGNSARDDIRRYIKELGITGLDDELLDQIFSWAITEKPSYTQLVEKLLGQAAGIKRQRSIARRIKESGLKDRKTLENFDFSFQPNLDKAVIEELATLQFVEKKEDLLFTGKAGTGKSHILKGIVLKACHATYYVRYVRGVDLLNSLYKALADGSYEHRLKQWARAQLLIIDDVGLGQLKKQKDEPTAAHTLFNIIDQRHQNVSTAISSNINLSEWGKYLGDATITAAILDRLAMTSIRVDINGPSYRKHQAKLRAEERSKSKKKPRC